MEAGAVLAPCFEPSGVAGVFVGFYWGRGAVTLLAFILHCDFWVGLCDFFSSLASPGLHFGAGKLLPGAPGPRGSGAVGSTVNSICVWFWCG